MRWLLFVWCFGVDEWAAAMNADYQFIPLIKGLNIYLSNATMDVGKALMEQANHLKMHTMVYHARVWGKDISYFKANIFFDDSLGNKRLITNVIFGGMTYLCEKLKPSSVREECESMNTDLGDGLSTIVIQSEVKEVQLELECEECLGKVAAIASTTDRSDVSVAVTDFEGRKRRKHLKLGRLHSVIVIPQPERIEAIMGLNSIVEIKKNFIPYHNFYMCLVYPNNKIRYVKEEFLVSDLVVVADPWDEFYRLDFGAMLTINLTLEIGYRTNFFIILETGGGLLLATKPHQSVSVRQSVVKEVKFIVGPDMNNMPDFGSIKIRTDPGAVLVWHYLFRVESNNAREVIGRLVLNEMALGDLDGSDEVDFDQDGRDYALTTKDQEKFSRRRASSRKKSDQEDHSDFDGDTDTDNYQTSGGSKFGPTFFNLVVSYPHLVDVMKELGMKMLAKRNFNT